MKEIINIICELFKKVNSNLEEWKKSENGYDLLQVEEEIIKIFRESSGKIMGELLKELCEDKELEAKAIELSLKNRPWLKRGRYEEVRIKFLSGECVKIRTLYMYADRDKIRGRKKKKKGEGKWKVTAIQRSGK